MGAGTFDAAARSSGPSKEITMSMIDPKGSQPEALARFGESARNEGGKPDKPGLNADNDTAPIPTDLKLKQDAATKVLREGVIDRDEGAEEAIDKLPDRIAKK
jgi:hypothetical protein